MRLAILATLILWALIFGLIYLCFPTFGAAEKRKESRIVVPLRTYYKPGYQAVSLDWAKSMHRIAIRRTERLLPVRFSHRFEVIPATVVPHEKDYTNCYRIVGFENGACCPNEYLERHRVETRAWKRKEIAMFINPPVGANYYHGGAWLTGGIAFRTCWGGEPFLSLGVVNATEVNMSGEIRRHASAEVYRHELMHTAFNADHREKPEPLNVMQTFSPIYTEVERIITEQFKTMPDVGLPTLKRTLDQAHKCIRLNRKEQKFNKR